MNAPPGQRTWLERIFLTPTENRLRSGYRLTGQLLLLGILLGCFSISLGLWLFLYGQGSERVIFLLGQSIALPAVTLSVYVARRWLDKRSFGSLGLRLDRRALWDLLVGFGIAGAMMALIYLLEWAAGWLVFGGLAWDFERPVWLLGGVLGMLLVFLAVGWYEELLNRGYWLQNLEEGLNLFWAVLISSCVFALAHLSNPNLSAAAVLGLLLAGVFLAYGYTRTRQLWLPIGLHAGLNFFEGTVFGFPVSGLTDFPRLIHQTVDGPILMTGGAFGPEAGLVLLPALALGAILVYLYTRLRSVPAIGSQP
jgi:membrane protease YdiL (CAAX protease family)